MTGSPDALDLRCPACGAQTLRWVASTAVCNSCGHESPSLGPVPCLLAEPSHWRERWSTDLAAFSAMMRAAANATRRDLARFDLTTSARRRLQGFLDASERNAERIRALLATAGIVGSDDAETVDATVAQADGRLPLTHHYELLLRDWGWGHDVEENRRARDHLLGLVADRSWGRTLVLGAGAGRLAYDLHQAEAPSTTLALDLDPLLSLAAHAVLYAGGISLAEFPFAPDGAAWTDRVLQRPAAPLRPGLHWLVADAIDPPVRRGAWDTVLTSWFIDVCDVDVRELITRIRTLLAPDGRWVNTGPLLYPASRPPAQRYPPPEVLELVGLGGFEVDQHTLEDVDYLRSPMSGHARRESVLSFVAHKAEFNPAGDRETPPWLILRNRPVPSLGGGGSGQPLLDATAALVDGLRSIEDIADLLVQTLPPELDRHDATAALLLELLRRSGR